MRTLRTCLWSLAVLIALPAAAGAAQLNWTPCFEDAGPFQCSTMPPPELRLLLNPTAHALAGEVAATPFSSYAPMSQTALPLPSPSAGRR